MSNNKQTREGGAQQAVSVDPRYELDPSQTMIGRKVRTVDTDSEGNEEFFVGIITDYNPVTQEHCITYEVGTERENFEWLSATTSPDVVEILPDAAVKVESLPEPPSAKGGAGAVDTTERGKELAAGSD